jgi:hypothetical protein
LCSTGVFLDALAWSGRIPGEGVCRKGKVTVLGLGLVGPYAKLWFAESGLEMEGRPDLGLLRNELANESVEQTIKKCTTKRQIWAEGNDSQRPRETMGHRAQLGLVP